MEGTIEWDSSTDDELVRLAQRGEDAAFLELMHRTRHASTGLAVSILRDNAAAEDEVQDAYFKAWQHLSQFNGGARFSTWISRIVVNECLMRLRSARRAKLISLTGSVAGQQREPLQLADPAVTAEDSLGRGQLVSLVQREIRRLPPLLRNALLLHVDEVPAAEAAQRLGISVSAVKSRLVRARRELKRRVDVSAAALVNG